jgi:integrase
VPGRRDTKRKTPGTRLGPTGRRGRPKKGTVVTWTRKSGDVGFGVQFFDQHGIRRYERCGLASEGWSHRRAEIELENFEREVAAGTYRPTPDVAPTPEHDPLFLPYARDYLAEHAIEIRPNTRDFYDGLLRNHLAPYFKDTRLTEIDWGMIDAYKKQRLRLMQRIRAAKATGSSLRDPTSSRPLRLSERTINHSLDLLSQILEEAARSPDIQLATNPANDRKHRVKVPKTKPRDWLEPDEVMTLLEAAEQIDNPVRPRTRRKALEVRRLRDDEKLTIKQIAEQLQMSEGGVCWLYNREDVAVASPRRAAIATLSASGTRNTELCRLRWQDLDFQHGKILIRAAKTNQGVREIDMTPWLRSELLVYKTSLGDVQPGDLVFPTQRGTMRDKDNLNQRVIQPVQRAAARLRGERGLPPLPTNLTAHAFRRTYATMLMEAGASPRYVQRQLGHGSAKLTLEVYTRVSESRDRAALGQAFDELVAGAVAGNGDSVHPPGGAPVMKDREATVVNRRQGERSSSTSTTGAGTNFRQRALVPPRRTAYGQG